MSKNMMIFLSATLVVLLLGSAVFAFLGCNLRRPDPINSSVDGSVPAPTPARDIMRFSTIRVGGDMHTNVNFANNEYSVAQCRIPTPLPEGYPQPTPPGAIELKNYPTVRRAAISASMPPDWGMNFAFFPLFNHIKRRDIAMTSPVEMNYFGLASSESGNPERWTMAFLYRNSQLSEAGIDPRDRRILIEDIPPMTVVSIGMCGRYDIERFRQGIARLNEWLAGQAEWKPAGEPRALFYNGPEVPKNKKWSEAQIPVRPVTNHVD